MWLMTSSNWAYSTPPFFFDAGGMLAWSVVASLIVLLIAIRRPLVSLLVATNRRRKGKPAARQFGDVIRAADVVIVGAGAAGCSLAARLAGDTRFGTRCG